MTEVKTVILPRRGIDQIRRGRWMRLTDLETGDCFYFFKLWRWWRVPWIGWAMFS